MLALRKNMKQPLIKICGIKDAKTAYAAAKAGADFIGLVFAPTSKRLVNMDNAFEIADAARMGGAQPVAVVTDSSAEEILDICNLARIRWIQLHGTRAREEHHLLPKSFQRIYACSVFSDGRINDEDAVGVKHLDPQRDYLLFDGINAGSGKKFAWEQFSYQGAFPWFLSGGLNVNQVAQAINLLKPSGVDVSSGVEKNPGKKDIELIKQFIAAARETL